VIMAQWTAGRADRSGSWPEAEPDGELCEDRLLEEKGWASLANTIQLLQISLPSTSESSEAHSVLQ
jgi:hypothetical protein